METNDKLVRPNIRRFSHEMSFRFMTENGKYYRNYNPDNLGIAPFMPEFDSALNEFDEALEQVRKSPETDRIDAVINIHGKERLNGFVEVYNAHATEYKNTLAQHLGRIRKSGEN